MTAFIFYDYIFIFCVFICFVKFKAICLNNFFFTNLKLCGISFVQKACKFFRLFLLVVQALRAGKLDLALNNIPRDTGKFINRYNSGYFFNSLVYFLPLCVFSNLLLKF